MNLAKVRSAIGVTIALVLCLVIAPAAAAKDVPKANLLLLPPGTTVEELADAGFSPGVMSPGLGAVPAEQTYLDITQGNRVFDSLYDEDLPRLGSDCAAWTRSVEKRAESAPAEIVPFLLGREALRNGIGVFWVGQLDCAFGEVRRGYRQEEAGILFFLEAKTLLGNAREIRRFLETDLLIAIAAPRGESNEPVAIGIAGPGFDGNLTSDSTRLDGYVLSTDVAPTILNWFGLDVPSEMSGQPIRSEGRVDVGQIETLTERMGTISHRRGPVIGWSLLIWLGLLALAVVASRGRRAPGAVRLTGLSIVYLPALLLVGSALEPSQNAELLLVAAGAPLLGAATLALLRGYRGLAAAAAVTVAALAVDVIAGSPLTTLSLLGPNPGLGVRFYGIGNELEAILSVLVVAGTGAALAGFAPRASRERSALAFVAVGLAAAFVFAAGRFGADVGAAIVFPVGAAVAAAVELGRGRRSAVWLVVAAPFAGLGLLALIDLVSGANAHLTRSVLDAGGLGDLSDVAQRRLQLSAHSFARPVLLAFLPVVALLAVVAIVGRDRILAWLAGSRAMRAGLAGALAATLVGTLANDSGALLLEVGTAYLLVFTGFAWAESRRGASRAETHGSRAG